MSFRLPFRAATSLGGFALAFGLVSAPGAAQAQPVQAEIFFSNDVSGSISDSEWALIRNGYQAAFLDPGIQNTVASILTRGPLAVASGTWATTAQTCGDATCTTGFNINWRQISTLADWQQFANDFANQPRGVGAGSTNAGAGLQAAVDALTLNSFTSNRRVIDFQTDGVCNVNSPTPCNDVGTDIRDPAFAQGISINGLGIGAGAAGYLQSQVVTPDGSVFIADDDFNNFFAVVREKIGREVIIPSEAVPGPLPIFGAAAAFGYSRRLRSRIRQVAKG